VNRKAVDVTARRRAWASRAGVVVALAASALFALPATPALAAPALRNVSASPSAVDVNESVTVRFSLAFTGGGDDANANIEVSSNNPRLRCVSGCSVQNAVANSYEATFRRTAATLDADQPATITIVAVQDGLIEQRTQASVRVTLVGKPPPPQVETVAEVSGKVVNEANGAAVAGASVRLRDSQGRTYTKSTSSNGTFRFTGSESSPITPGSLELRVTKDGVTETLTVSGANGQRVTGRTIVLALAAAEPTPSPTPTEEEPTEEPEEDEEEEPTEEPTEESTAGSRNSASNESGGSGGSLLLILAGGLLVALGVGAIVLLWLRRKDDGGEDEPEDSRARASAGGRGYGDEPTRVATRAGAGGGPDATMVAGPSLADAPTMMHNAPLVNDEFPDPYGAPPPSPQSGPPGYGGGRPQQGWGEDDGYGGAPGSGGGAYGSASGSGAGGYGAAPTSGPGYGAAPTSGPGYGGGSSYGNAPGSGAGYGAPVSGAGYRDGAGGYDDRYDEPTGRYTGRDSEYGPPVDPYDSGGYGPTSGGGYEPTRRFDQDGGYDGGGYGGAGRGGYDDPHAGGYGRGDGGYGDDYQTRAGGGYGPQGYDDRGGYDQPTAGAGYDQPTRGGYDAGGYDDRGGYGQRDGGYYDDPPRAGGGHGHPGVPHQGGRGERRSLDWLDD